MAILISASGAFDDDAAAAEPGGSGVRGAAPGARVAAEARAFARPGPGSRRAARGTCTSMFCSRSRHRLRAGGEGGSRAAGFGGRGRARAVVRKRFRRAVRPRDGEHLEAVAAPRAELEADGVALRELGRGDVHGDVRGLRAAGGHVAASADDGEHDLLDFDDDDDDDGRGRGAAPEVEEGRRRRREGQAPGGLAAHDEERDARRVRALARGVLEDEVERPGRAALPPRDGPLPEELEPLQVAPRRLPRRPDAIHLLILAHQVLLLHEGVGLLQSRLSGRKGGRGGK